MVKSTKKKVSTQSKTITDFFTKASPNTSSQSTQSKTSTAKTTPRSVVASSSSSRELRPRQSERQPEQAQGAESRLKVLVTQGTSSCPVLTPMEVTNRQTTPERTPWNKRKSPVDVERTSELVIYDKRSSTTTALSPNATKGLALSPINTDVRPHKKARQSPPFNEIIPSSQSDEEEEPIFPHFDMDLSAPEHPEDAMDLDVHSSAPLTPKSPVTRSSHSPLSERDDAFMFTPVRVSSSPDTPPFASCAMEADSPTPMTSEAKTAKIIADIKAQAQANAANMPSSPEHTPVDLGPLSESDDDLEIDWKTFNKDNGKTVEPASSPIDEVPTYRLRSSKRSSAKTSDVSLSPKAGPSAAQLKKSFNPIKAMLQKKHKADKAERAARSAEDAILGDEDAARPVIADTRSSPSSYYTSGDEELDEEQERRLLDGFGEQGDAILGILRKDKQEESVVTDAVKVLGIPLWKTRPDEDVFMDPPQRPIKTFQDVAGQRTLQMLKASIDDRDLGRAKLLLDANIVASVDLQQYPDTVADLCHLALLDNSAVADSAFRFLIRLWGTPSKAPGISFASVLSAMTNLGALWQPLQSLGWAVQDECESPPDPTKRGLVLFKLIALIDASARSQLMVKDEIPNMLLLLILLALDNQSTPSLQLGILRAVNAVCCCIADIHNVDKIMESTISTRLLQFLSTLAPINQTHCVRLFSGSSGCCQRMARWLAHGIILNSKEVTPESYSDTPPLDPLIRELEEHEVGHFKLNDKTDFEDLGFHTVLLCVATSNIASYVSAEEFPTTNTPPILVLAKLLDSMHNDIVDTRAAHLDRSRTKALLKNVSMKLQYRRKALVSRRKQHQKNIFTYFKKDPAATTSN